MNFCSISKNYYKCEKCKPDYYLTTFGNSCMNTPHCYVGNKEIGICTNCEEGYSIDYKDG